MDDSETEQHLSVRHSFCTAPSVKKFSGVGCKSDINVQRHKEYNKVDDLGSLCDYYKNYEHDVLPVKDTISEVTGYREKPSLTNSDIDKLEMKIYKNISDEFRKETNSASSLESNIKFFKTTVQEIFDNFYENMRDFELYKERFHEILAKNENDAVADMEDFLMDIIKHITSPDSCMSQEDVKSTISNDSDISSKTYAVSEETSLISSVNGNRNINVKKPENTNTDPGPNSSIENVQPVVEAYKNFDYNTDSTMDDSKCKPITSTSPRDEVVNIFLLNGAACVQIKMNNRNLLSEINIKEPALDCKNFASADDVRKLAEKKKEIDRNTMQDRDYDDNSDRGIPVKVSYAKRSIPLDEDFTIEHENRKLSLISRLCDFLCKKFRKP